MSIDPGLHYPLDLTSLPKSWEVCYVGDRIRDIQPGFASGAHNQEGRGVPHLRPMNIDRLGAIDFTLVKSVEDKDGPRLREGDVLFNNTNSPELVGKTAAIQSSEDWAFSNHMTRLRPPPTISGRFVAHQLHYVWMSGYFKHRCVKHVNQASISSSTLARTVPLILPPLPEQHRIVSEIEKQFTRLDAGVAALRRVQANLKRYRAAVLKAACEGRLVPTEAELARTGQRDQNYESAQALLSRVLAESRMSWSGRGRYKEPAAPDAKGLPNLPEGWTWATMPQLGDLNRGRSKHRPRDDARLYGGAFPFIQTGDIRKSRGTIREHTQTYSEFGLRQSRLWPTGTLCITIAANIAETGILTFETCFPDSVVGFTHHGSAATTRYVEFFIRTAKEKLDQFAPATAQKNINLDVLQRVAVPLPPLAEQVRIVAEAERRLSIVEELEATISRNIQHAIRLRKSILTKAFSPVWLLEPR